jgi:hypothetical protein
MSKGVLAAHPMTTERSDVALARLHAVELRSNPAPLAAVALLLMSAPISR